jgi:phosphoribosylaminoimidazole-succinocarboxamide synthase
MISSDHLEALGLLNSEEAKEIKKMAFEVTHFLMGFFSALGLQLNDVKLEFGRRYNELIDDSEIVLADEISLDTCHLVDMVDHSTLGYKSLNDCEDHNEAVYKKFIQRCPFSLLDMTISSDSQTEESQVISLHEKRSSTNGNSL